MADFNIMTNFSRPVQLFIMLFVINLFLVATVCKSIGVFTAELSGMERLLGGDKIVHFLVSFVITFVAMQFVPLHRLKPHYLFNRVTLMIAFGFMVEESSQLFLSSRHFSFSDIAANMLGIIIAASTIHSLSWYRMRIQGK